MIVNVFLYFLVEVVLANFIMSVRIFNVDQLINERRSSDVKLKWLLIWWRTFPPCRYSNIDVLIGADLFYDPIVAKTFITDVVVPFLLHNTKTKCLASTSVRNEKSWLSVLQMFEKHQLQWNIIYTTSCPLSTNARVEVALLSLKK